MSTQKTLTIAGVKLTPNKIKSLPQCKAMGGHNITTIIGVGEIHWMEYNNGEEIHIFNVGAIRKRNAHFGEKVIFLKV
jgi:hypothetical protein